MRVLRPVALAVAAIMAGVSLALLLVPLPVYASTYTVNSTGDADDASAGDDVCATAGSVCTLRAAIQEANAHSGADVIDVPLTATISPGTSYTLTGAVSVLGHGNRADGWTVLIDGSGITGMSQDIFIAGAAGQTIDGFELFDAPVDCIRVDADATITNNYAHGCEDGVFTSTLSDGATITDNVFSDSLHWGIDLQGANATVLRNYVGLAPDGLTAAPNANDGLLFSGSSATGNIVGGTTLADANVISGNTGKGVDGSGGASGNTLRFNYVGRDASGADSGVCNGAFPEIALSGAFTKTGNVTCQSGCCVYPGNSTSPLAGVTCLDAGATNARVGSEAACVSFDGFLDGGDHTGYVADADCSTPGDHTSQCIALTATPTSTPTPTATATSTPTPGSVVDTTGFCRATGDKENLSAATALNTSPLQLVALPFVVPSADDPWFFQCNVVVFNQSNAPAQITVTMSEASGLFAPMSKTFDIGGAGLSTWQVNMQTFGITPNSYELRCSATTNRKKVIVAQPATYAAAWRLGSSESNCPAGGGGSGLGTQVCLDETKATAAAASVSTTGTVPAGAILDTCITETLAAVAGGYTVGMAGAEARFGRVTGTLNSTNRLDPTMPSPFRLVGTAPLKLTSTHASGSFQNTTGRIRVTCFCRDLVAPTTTPTVVP